MIRFNSIVASSDDMMALSRVSKQGEPTTENRYTEVAGALATVCPDSLADTPLARRLQRQTPRKRAKRATARKVRIPPANGKRLARRPHISLIGHTRIVSALRDDLRRLGIRAVVELTPRELIANVDEATRAVVIAPPVPDESIEEICKRLRSNHVGLPIFPTIRATLPWKAEGRLYEAGATTVFLWPTERATLLQTLIGLVRVPSRVSDKEPKDQALGAVVRARIKGAVELQGCRLLVRVIRRVIIMTGTVKSLWQAEVAADIARDVPGVQDVVYDTLEIESDGSSDREIATAIRRLIQSTSELDPRTLALDVKHGRVAIAGSVNSPVELERMHSLIQQVRGIRGLENFVTVSPNARKRDRALAKEVEKALAVRYPSLRIGVAAFGGVAVLRGAVPSARTKQEIKKSTIVLPGVERVVSKLTVRRQTERKT